ncbi:MAG: phage portal protein [Bacteroides sp.]|nr:phage portal protein [Eubacterium sp.]MCM1419518.1 phage portal protein [Roseburia sp.]MCM1463448.1 phage portal protein [Bacteroides sp.]
MKLFSRKEKRSAEGGSVGIEDSLLTALIGGGSEVTKKEALQIPTVSACITLIADRISSLPIKLYRQDGKEVTEIVEDRRLDLLNHDTGDTINASELKKLWIRDYFLGKGAYTYIERNLYNEPTGLFYVDEARVSIAPNADPIRKTYAIRVNGEAFFPHQFLKILRCSNGFGEGTSIIKENPLALATFYNTMRFENATIRKGGNKKGYILAKNKLTKEAIAVVKESWQKLYSNNYDTRDNAVVLNDGMDFKETSATSVELQLNENKRTNAAEICKLFCMPIDVLNGKAAQETLSQFVQNCLMPPINTIEAALDHDLLTEAEKAAHYYFAFDTSELTRGDFASRINAYAVALQNNIYQLDEIREMEDKPPLNFNYIRLSLADVLLDPRTGKIYTPNTDKMALMGANSGLTAEEKDDTIEKRHNPYHDPTNGRLTSPGSFAAPGLRMSKKELNRVSSAIITDHPELKSGERIAYEYESYFYIATSLSQPGDYYFSAKIKLTAESQKKVKKMREKKE